MDIQQHVKGVKFNLTLNSLNFYHVCNPRLPPCMAPDLLKGFILIDLLIIYKYFNSIGLISFDQINIFLADLGKN